MAGKKSHSRSSKTGLQFPVGHIVRYLKAGRYAKHVSAGASVILAATLEYVVAKVFELAGDVARDNKKARITLRHIQLVVRGDYELNKLFRDVTIAYGSVREHIYDVLLPRKKANVVAKEEEKKENYNSNDSIGSIRLYVLV